MSEWRCPSCKTWNSIFNARCTDCGEPAEVLGYDAYRADGSLADVAGITDVIRGQQQAAAPQAPLDPKVGQMSEDAKAFGPAAQPSELRAENIRLQMEVESLRKGLDFRPLGDNHHNAALCPYCSPQAANAEGAKALEIARAEGKAEGRREMAEEWILDACGTKCNCSVAKSIRSLIPAAPGGGGK